MPSRKPRARTPLKGTVPKNIFQGSPSVLAPQRIAELTPELRRICYRQMKKSGLIGKIQLEDLVAIVQLSLLSRPVTIVDPDNNTLRFLAKIIQNKATDLARKYDAERVAKGQHIARTRWVIPEESLTPREIRDILRKRLTKREAMVMLLKMRKVHVRAIAAKMEIGVDTVVRDIDKARKKLKKRILE